jgi:hypothetical protein
VVVGFEIQKASIGYVIDRLAALQIVEARRVAALSGAPMGGFHVGPPMRPPPTHHGHHGHASSAYVGGLGTSGLAPPHGSTSAAAAAADPSSTYVPLEVARLVAQLSRNHPERVRRQFAAHANTNANGRRADAWGEKRGAGLVLEGRIVLNLWRILRTEVKLNTYTFESCAWNILAQRVPRFAPRALSDMYGPTGSVGGNGIGSGGGNGGNNTSGSNGSASGGASASGSGSGNTSGSTSGNAAAFDPVAKHTCVAYALRRAQLNLALIDKLDIVGRTSELARVFGQDFTSVLARGSQYRVESMLVCARVCVALHNGWAGRLVAIFMVNGR